MSIQLLTTLLFLSSRNSIACCRQYEERSCTRGGFCNFMHLKPVTKTLKRELYQGQRLSIKLLKPRGDEEDQHHRAPRKTYRGNYKGGRDDYLDEGWGFVLFDMCL